MNKLLLRSLALLLCLTLCLSLLAGCAGTNNAAKPEDSPVPAAEAVQETAAPDEQPADVSAEDEAADEGPAALPGSDDEKEIAGLMEQIGEGKNSWQPLNAFSLRRRRNERRRRM